MTTTEEKPETVTEPTSVELDAKQKGYIKVKRTHGIDIYLSPKDGQFYAFFSQGSDNKWFDRPTLGAMEQLLTTHVYPYSGHVEVGTRPGNLVNQHDIERLQQGLEKATDYYAVPPVRPTKVLTGVQRREYGRGGSEVFFRNDKGNSEQIQSGYYVRPNTDLDAEYYRLAQEYLKNQIEWRERFAAVADKYEPVTFQDVVAELKAQGARVGRA